MKVLVLHIDSYIRGHRAYMEVWTPVQDEIHVLILKRECTNVVDRNAVAILKDQVVDHVPFNYISISLFSKRDINICKIVGGKVNRGAGYGLEIPCVYHLYGPKPYTDKM